MYTRALGKIDFDRPTTGSDSLRCYSQIHEYKLIVAVDKEWRKECKQKDVGSAIVTVTVSLRNSSVAIVWWPSISASVTTCSSSMLTWEWSTLRGFTLFRILTIH